MRRTDLRCLHINCSLGMSALKVLLLYGHSARLLTNGRYSLFAFFPGICSLRWQNGPLGRYLSNGKTDLRCLHIHCSLGMPSLKVLLLYGHSAMLLTNATYSPFFGLVHTASPLTCGCTHGGSFGLAHTASPLTFGCTHGGSCGLAHQPHP